MPQNISCQREIISPATCTHPRMLPGLEQCYCPDCRAHFSSRSQEYKHALEATGTNQSYVTESEPTTAQVLHKIPTGTNQSYVTPTPDLAADLLHKIRSLTLEQLLTLRDHLDQLIASRAEPEDWVVPIKPGREVVERRRVGSSCYQLEKIRCGKPNCKCGAGRFHGPYWYAYERRNGKVKSRYVGKILFHGRN